jgi:hypothetical protein
MSLALPRTLEDIDGRPISSGTITHYVKIPMGIEGHEEHARLFVTTLGLYPIMLGIPWLRCHHVKTNWVANSLNFDSPFCLKRYNDNHIPITQPGISSALPE